jgi:hypothetical protein
MTLPLVQGTLWRVCKSHPKLGIAPASMPRCLSQMVVALARAYAMLSTTPEVLDADAQRQKEPL